MGYLHGLERGGLESAAVELFSLPLSQQCSLELYLEYGEIMLQCLFLPALHVLPEPCIVAVFTKKIMLPSLETLEHHMLAILLHLSAHQLQVLLFLVAKGNQPPET